MPGHAQESVPWSPLTAIEFLIQKATDMTSYAAIDLVCLVHDLAMSLVELNWFAERQWLCTEEAPYPGKVAMDVGMVIRKAQDLAEQLNEEPILSLLNSLQQAVEDAWAHFENAWGSQIRSDHIRRWKEAEACDIEFHEEVESLKEELVAESPLGGCQWAEIQKQTKELEGALPAPLAEAFTLTTLLAVELQPADVYRQRYEQNNKPPMTEESYLSVVLPRKIHRLIKTLEQHFPTLASVNHEIADVSTYSVNANSSRLLKTIHRRLSAVPSSLPNEQLPANEQAPSSMPVSTDTTSSDQFSYRAIGSVQAFPHLLPRRGNDY